MHPHVCSHSIWTIIAHYGQCHCSHIYDTHNNTTLPGYLQDLELHCAANDKLLSDLRPVQFIALTATIVYGELLGDVSSYDTVSIINAWAWAETALIDLAFFMFVYVWSQG